MVLALSLPKVRGTDTRWTGWRQGLSLGPL